MPLRHRHHTTNARLAHRRRRTQRIAVEGEEARLQPRIARGLDQQRQIIAPVAGNDRIRARGRDTRDVRRKILHLADRMQHLANNGHIRPLLAQLLTRRLRHLATECVVLPNQIDLLDRLVRSDHLGQRMHAHIGRGIKAEMPEAAGFVGQRRIDSGVVQVQHTRLWMPLVVARNRRRQRSRSCRTVALQNEANSRIGCRLQLQQGFIDCVLAIQAHQRKRMTPIRQLHTPTCIHPFDGEAQIAIHSLPRVGKRAGQAFDQCQPDRRSLGLRDGCAA